MRSLLNSPFPRVAQTASTRCCLTRGISVNATARRDIYEGSCRNLGFGATPVRYPCCITFPGRHPAARSVNQGQQGYAIEHLSQNSPAAKQFGRPEVFPRLQSEPVETLGGNFASQKSRRPRLHRHYRWQNRVTICVPVFTTRAKSASDAFSLLSNDRAPNTFMKFADRSKEFFSVLRHAFHFGARL